MITLEEKGTPWRLSPLQPGEHKSPSYLAMHPFGRIPVLQADDFLLYETQAILRYLDRILPNPALTPTDPRAAARMDQLLCINDWYLFQGCSDVIAFQRIVGPLLLGLEPNLQAIEQALPRAHLVFQQISQLLGDQPFLAGASLSLADILLGAHIEFFARTPEWSELTQERSNLVAWLERLESRPSFQKTVWERLSDLSNVA